MTLLSYAIYSTLTVYSLWFFYLAVMSLARAKSAGTLTLTAKILGFPIFLTGYLLDIFTNIFVFTFLFLELPKEFLVTARVKRHLYKSTGWRESLAAWFCYQLLNAFDPDGKHC